MSLEDKEIVKHNVRTESEAVKKELARHTFSTRSGQICVVFIDELDKLMELYPKICTDKMVMHHMLNGGGLEYIPGDIYAIGNRYKAHNDMKHR